MPTVYNTKGKKRSWFYLHRDYYGLVRADLQRLMWRTWVLVQASSEVERVGSYQVMKAGHEGSALSSELVHQSVSIFGLWGVEGSTGHCTSLMGVVLGSIPS